MIKSNPSIDRSMFLDRLKSGEPTTFKNIVPGKMGIGFYNSFRGSTFLNGASHVQFKVDKAEVLSIADIKTKTAGVYTVTGALQWLSDAKEVQGFLDKSPGNQNVAQPSRRVREAVIADSTGIFKYLSGKNIFHILKRTRPISFLMSLLSIILVTS